MKNRFIIALVIALLLLLAIFGASNFLARQALLGKWQAKQFNQTFEFLSDGQVLINGKRGDGWADKNVYSFDGSMLLITASGRSAYLVSIQGDELTLTPMHAGGGLPQTFIRAQK